jgi:hypothetical protein
LIYDVCMARGVVFIGLAYLAAACVAVRAEERVTSGLVVLYDFEEGAGTTVRDCASGAMARYTCTDQKQFQNRSERRGTGTICSEDSAN